MKCPICGSKMSVSYGSGEELLSCSNIACKASYFFATDDMWQELIKVMEENKRTRKALDVAKGVLKEQQRWFGVIRVSLISHLNNEYGTLFKSYDADPTVVNVKRANDILNRAIEQITALEQKDE